MDEETNGKENNEEANEETVIEEGGENESKEE